MQRSRLAGRKQNGRRRIKIGGMSAREEQLYSEYEHAVSFYDVTPSGEKYNYVDLEILIQACRERQTALGHIESMSIMDGDHMAKTTKVKERMRESLKLLSFTPDSTKKQRFYSDLSHWMFRLGFCRTNELKAWLTTQETSLFRFQLRQLTQKQRNDVYQAQGLKFPTISVNDLEKRKEFIRNIPLVWNKSWDDVIKMKWYLVPFQHVHSLVRSRQTYLEAGNAYVPEDSLIEFFVTKFRANLSRGLAIASKKAALALNGEEDRLAPIVKTFGNFMNLEADFSSEGGRLTLSNFDAVAKASAPPCSRQMLDALSIDKKLKHDGRLHLWGFLKAAGMTLDDTLKFSMQRMTAYQNVEKEHGYNIRHAYGREGHGKGLGSYGCMNKINAVPADGQYHGCPFKHGQKNLLAKVQSWGVKNEKKAKKIVQIAKDGKYQHACACFFESNHDIEDTGNLFITHPNNYFDQSFKWRNKQHPLQTGVKEEKETYSSNVSSQAYSEFEWKNDAPATKRQKDNEFDEDDESFIEASQSSSMMS